MTAAVYAREIREQYDCGRCQASAHEWHRLGRCDGPFPEGGHVELRMEGRPYPAGATYPAAFESCPAGLLRRDVFPREAAVAALVSHAANADYDKRWPDVPARLQGLLRVWREVEADRATAQHEASVKGIREAADGAR